jgi:hypothetical protein
MRLRRSVVVVLGCLLMLGLTQLSLAQQSGSGGRSRLGASNQVRPVDDASIIAAAAVTFTGKLVFSISITIQSTLPTTDAIACEGAASLDDVGAAGSGQLIEEIAAVQATRSGSTATCTVTIPYSWALLNSATDQVQLTYTISVPSNGVVGATGLPARVSTKGFASIKVPATGATTTETIKATI